MHTLKYGYGRLASETMFGVAKLDLTVIDVRQRVSPSEAKHKISIPCF